MSPDNENIVKKVFERPESGKVSPLFTYFKNPSKAKAKPSKGPGKSSARRLPVAIDFGVSRIKLLQMAQDSRGGLEVELMDEELLAEEGGGSSLTKNKQALEKLLSRNKVGPQAVVGVPTRETQTYNFTFPPMSEDELREAVRWKIKQLRPFELDEESVRYSLLRWDPAGTTAGGQQRVTVVCVSNANLIWKSSLLGEAGLKPVSMHVSALSLVQTKRYANVPKNTEDVVLWLDLGAEESVCIVEKGGVVYFLRALSVTGRQMTRQIAQSFRVDERAAEDLKTRHGMEAWSAQFQNNAFTDEDRAKNPSMATCGSLVSLLENLVLDIEHSFKSFSYQVTQSQIVKFDRILLTGGASNLKKVDTFLADRLGVPVDRLNPFTSLQLSESLRARRQNVAEDGARFASAAGLALTQTPGAVPVPDLLAPGKKRKKPAAIGARISARPKAALALAGVVGVMLVAPQMAMTVYYKKEAASMAKQVKAARVDIKHGQESQLQLAEQEKQLIEKKAALEEKLSLFRASGKEKHAFSSTLTHLAALMPEDIWVTKLTYADNRLTLVASTSKNEAMIQFLENLRKPDDFSDVVFNYTKRDPKSPVFSFEVMMGVK